VNRVGLLFSTTAWERLRALAWLSMKVWWLVGTAAAGLLACRAEPPTAAGATASPRRDVLTDADAPRLSPTRQLRRLWLATRGREPEVTDYEAALAAADAGAFEPFFARQLEAALASTDFAELTRSWGHDYLKVGDFKRGTLEGGPSHPFKTAMAIFLGVCPAGTANAGAFVTDDAVDACDAASDGGQATTVRSLEPWWAPGTTVRVLGFAGAATQPDAGVDCGRVSLTQATQPVFPNAACSCGPNLIHCRPKPLTGPAMYPQLVDSSAYVDTALRRLVWEEPARLFEYIVTTDKPFSDLVQGDYLVAPRNLQHVYWRWGRMNGDASLDANPWWRTASDRWEPVVAETLNPRLLRRRTYTYDPRTEDGEPLGIPAAGVLTQLGPQSWFPRERVRAARYLEIFACRSFAAPDPSIVFTPAYTRDPYSEGTCQHCHKTLDPAAIHFKRLEVEDDGNSNGQGFPNLGGVGMGRWGVDRRCYTDANAPGGINWRQPYGRWHANFISNTFLTPVPESRFGPPCQTGAPIGNPDARLLDFLPRGQTLFGLESDGTIGPLGFGKLLVQSGEFDRCAVRHVFERFAGRPLDLATEGPLERELVTAFTGNDRRVKDLIRLIVQRDEFRRGL
jgi:hypothetical protein